MEKKLQLRKEHHDVILKKQKFLSFQEGKNLKKWSGFSRKENLRMTSSGNNTILSKNNQIWGYDDFDFSVLEDTDARVGGSKINTNDGADLLK